MDYDQTDRILAITSSLGANKAVLIQLEGEDAISRPFVFHITFASEEPPSSIKSLLGTALTLEFGWPGDGGSASSRRHFNGRISRLTRGVSSRGEATEWRAEIVPDIWFLSRTTDSCIYQNKSIPDIIKDKLSKHGVINYTMRLSGTYDPVEYCVQYRETTLNFISRLAEEAGIFYWHEHEDGKHTLVFSDINNNTRKAPWPAVNTTGKFESGAITTLREEFAVRSHSRALRDFNFEQVDKLPVDVPTTQKVAAAGFSELYDYPGRYQSTGAGRDIAERQMEEDEAPHQVFTGDSGVAGLNAGLRIEVSDLDSAELLMTEVRHRAQDYSHWTTNMWGDRKPVAPTYENSFTAIPKAVPFRAERRSHKPFVQGPQTAIVTGPAGEEIHTDEHGRVKVAFHWDRADPNDDTSSCWLRVSQGWAGSRYGEMHIPRIGHEVIVSFLEGDPDRPIVTGRVYNGKNKVPWGLPGNKTQSGIKTDSSLGGGGSNEMRFEDKAGSEQIYVHAQKDLDSEVENNETRKVGLKGTGDRTTDIKNNETLTVGGNKTTTVKGNFDETIEGTETRKVTGNVTETFMANEDRTILGSQKETITGTLTQTVTGSLSQTVVGGITIQTPATMTIMAAGGFTVVAPAGTKTVDSFFKKVGSINEDSFGLKLSLHLTKVDLIPGITSCIYGNKVDIGRVKVDQCTARLQNTPLNLQNRATAIEFGSFRMSKAYLTLLQ